MQSWGDRFRMKRWRCIVKIKFFGHSNNLNILIGGVHLVDIALFYPRFLSDLSSLQKLLYLLHLAQNTCAGHPNCHQIDTQ